MIFLRLRANWSTKVQILEVYSFVKNKLKMVFSRYPRLYSVLKNISSKYGEVKLFFRLIACLPFLIFPIDKNKIVVCNYFGKGYGDNGKYIVEKIKEQELEYDVVWLLKSDLFGKVTLPAGVRVVKYGSLRGLYELSTAKVWLDNSRKEFFPVKRKNQYYIQTWHSPLRLKKIEKDAESKLSPQYVKLAKKDSQNIDLLISGCDFSWNIYRHSFWYEGEILKCGTPRCDLFFYDNKDIKDKVLVHFGLTDNYKLIIFAPTFRSSHNLEPYVLEFKRILETVKKRFGGEWKLLVRLHPNVSSLASLIKYDEEIINATEYEDMQELLSASDILITDYSSSMFDMVIARKICFVHGADMDSYLEKERDLYFNFGELPFAFSKTTQELLNNIVNYNEEAYLKRLNTFSKKIGLYENGTASEQLVERIKEVSIK